MSQYKSSLPHRKQIGRLQFLFLPSTGLALSDRELGAMKNIKQLLPALAGLALLVCAAPRVAASAFMR